MKADGFRSDMIINSDTLTNALIGKKTMARNTTTTVTVKTKVEGVSEIDKLNQKLKDLKKNQIEIENVKRNTTTLNYYKTQEEALNQLIKASKNYKVTVDKNGKQTRHGSVDVKAWGNAFIALGGDINNIPEEVANLYKELERIESIGVPSVEKMKNSFKSFAAVPAELQGELKGLVGTIAEIQDKMPKKIDFANIDSSQIKNMQVINDEISILETKLSELYSKMDAFGDGIDFTYTQSEAKEFLTTLEKLNVLYQYFTDDKFIDDKFFNLREQMGTDGYQYNFEAYEKDAERNLKRIVKIANGITDEQIKSEKKVQKEVKKTAEVKSEVQESKPVQNNPQIQDQKELQKEIKETQNKAEELARKLSQKTLYHRSEEDFGDYFDTSKSTMTTYGKGGYFSLDKNKNTNYGNIISEWFGQITKTFDSKAKLSEFEIEKIYNDYQEYINKLSDSRMLQGIGKILDFDVSNLEGFKEFMNNTKATTQLVLDELAKISGLESSSDIFKNLGYDSYYDEQKSILNIFDSEKISKEMMQSASIVESAETKKQEAIRKTAEVKAEAQNEKPVSSDTTPLVEGQDKLQESVETTVDSYKKLLDLLFRIKNVGKSSYEGKYNSDWIGIYSSQEEAIEKDLADRKNDLHSSLNIILSEDKNALESLQAEADGLKTSLKPVQDMVSRISSNSSLKELDKNKGSEEWYKGYAEEYKRIDDRLGELQSQYRLTNEELEEYITLQIKAEKIIKVHTDRAGGVKGSGAKDTNELHQWIERSFARDLGLNPDDIYRGLFGHITDALYEGLNGVSLYDNNGVKKNLRYIAGELLDYQGTLFNSGYGADEDAEKLNKVNIVLNYIKSNLEEISSTNFSAQIKNATDYVKYYEEKVSEGKDSDFYTKCLEDAKERLQELIDLQNRLNKARGLETSSTQKFDNETTLSSPAVETNKEIEQSANAATQAEENLAKAEKQANENGLLSGTSETNLPALQAQENQIEETNEDLEKEKSLLDQIVERIEKIRMLGLVGGGKSEEEILNNFGAESKNAEAYRMQLDALKTLSPSGQLNPKIRDMVLNPDISAEDVANKLIEAANDYKTCKDALDKMFSENNIVGGKVFEDAYRQLDLFADDGMKMLDVISETRQKIASMKSDKEYFDGLKNNTSQATIAISQEGKTGENAGEQIAEGQRVAREEIEKTILTAKELSDVLINMYGHGNVSSNGYNNRDDIKLELDQFLGHINRSDELFKNNLPFDENMVKDFTLRTPNLPLIGSEALGRIVALLKNKTQEMCQVIIDYHDGMLTYSETIDKLSDMIENSWNTHVAVQNAKNKKSQPNKSDISIGTAPLVEEAKETEQAGERIVSEIEKVKKELTELLLVNPNKNTTELGKMLGVEGFDIYGLTQQWLDSGKDVETFVNDYVNSLSKFSKTTSDISIGQQAEANAGALREEQKVQQEVNETRAQAPSSSTTQQEITANEEAVEVEKAKAKAQEEVTESAKQESKANGEVAETAENTSKASSEEADAMEKVSKAAQTGAKAKREFADANKAVAESAKETKAAVDGEAESMQFIENIDLQKYLQKIQSTANDNPLKISAKLDEAAYQAELKKIAPMIAQQYNEANGTNITANDIVKTWNQARNEAIKEEQEVQKLFAEMRKEAYQSIGQKSPELTEMAEYYKKLEIETKKEQEEISKGNKYLSERLSKLNEIKQSYVEGGTSQKYIKNEETLSELEEKRKTIIKEINELQNKPVSTDDKTRIESLISEYNLRIRKAKNAENRLNESSTGSEPTQNEKDILSVKSQITAANKQLKIYQELTAKKALNVDLTSEENAKLTMAENVLKAVDTRITDITNNIKGQSGEYQKELRTINEIAQAWQTAKGKDVTGDLFTSAYANIEKQISKGKEMIKSGKYIKGSDAAFNNIVNSESLQNILNKGVDATNFEKAIKFANQLEAAIGGIEKAGNKISVNKIGSKAIEMLKKNSAMSKGLKRDFNALIEDAKRLGEAEQIPNEAAQELGRKFEQLRFQMEYAGKTGDSLFVGLAKRTASITKSLAGMYLSPFMAIMRIKELVNEIVELDDALIDLSKTFKGSQQQLDEFYYSANDTAIEMGVTTKEIIEQASAWSRFNKIDPLYSNV